MSEDFFTDDNEQAREEIISPSGQYLLVVRYYSTKENCWNYSRGTIYRHDTANEAGSPSSQILCDRVSEIADVKRNYSAFPYAWVESHPNGHDYLVCGEDYQGQTVVELDTGRRRDHLPPEAEKGVAFCWASAKFESVRQMLVVCGCHWACPYEYRFFDFSAPMAGWPEIEAPMMIEADAKAPVVDGGVVKFFQTHRVYIPLGKREHDDALDNIPDSDLDNKSNWRTVEDAVVALRREGAKFAFIDEWVSDEERAQRQSRKEADEKYEQWKRDFKAGDALYLKYAELSANPVFSPDSFESIGVTHKDWCPTFTRSERRWCRRIVDGKKRPYTIDLEWAVETGPVKLQIFKAGKIYESRFFPHSVEGMAAAFEYAKNLVTA